MILVRRCLAREERIPGLVREADRPAGSHLVVRDAEQMTARHLGGTEVRTTYTTELSQYPFSGSTSRLNGVDLVSQGHENHAASRSRWAL